MSQPQTNWVEEQRSWWESLISLFDCQSLQQKKHHTFLNKYKLKFVVCSIGIFWYPTIHQWKNNQLNLEELDIQIEQELYDEKEKVLAGLEHPKDYNG